MGRPRKAAQEKVVKINTSYNPGNYKYIMKIIEDRKLQSKGNFVKIVNEIISDHQKVSRYKAGEAAKLKAQLENLE